MMGLWLEWEAAGQKGELAFGQSVLFSPLNPSPPVTSWAASSFPTLGFLAPHTASRLPVCPTRPTLGVQDRSEKELGSSHSPFSLSLSLTFISKANERENFAVSLLKCSQQPELSQTAARSWELSLAVPRGWQGCKCLSHLGVDISRSGSQTQELGHRMQGSQVRLISCRNSPPPINGLVKH